MRTKRYTELEFIEAVASSTSLRQILNKLGLAEAGGNYFLCRKHISDLQLDDSHITGKGSNKGKIFGPKRNIEEYLSNRCSILSYKLKNRLLKEKILLPICSNCKLETWLNSPIPLELHHINGNSQDNTLSNICLLCPNCHAFTITYRGKNKKD